MALVLCVGTKDDEASLEFSRIALARWHEVLTCDGLADAIRALTAQQCDVAVLWFPLGPGSQYAYADSRPLAAMSLFISSMSDLGRLPPFVAASYAREQQFRTLHTRVMLSPLYKGYLCADTEWRPFSERIRCLVTAALARP